MSSSENPFDRSALHLAVLAGDATGVRSAIDVGEDVNAPEGRSYTPLHLAVQEGNAEIVAVLLAAGADVEARTSTGVTALRLAAQKWKKSPDGAIIRLLKKNGASADSKDNEGRSVASVVMNLFRFPPELLELTTA